MTNEIKTFDNYSQGVFGMEIDKRKPEEIAKGMRSTTEEARETSTIKAAVVMAKQDRRVEAQCYADIIETCKRPSLAETAMYAFPRGGKLVEGPSIRLAEIMARHWGNMRVGITITNQTDDKTDARAYAYDLQTNYMVDQDFTVPHKRTTKKGVTRLTDERDIRELVQSIGSRYLRGCILRLIPADIVEDAVNRVKQTLLNSEVPLSDQIKKMVLAFDELGINVALIEKRLGHNIDATVPQEIVSLKSVYRSIKDGMAKREDFFDFAASQDAKEKLDSILKKNPVEIGETMMAP